LILTMTGRSNVQSAFAGLNVMSPVSTELCSMNAMTKPVVWKTTRVVLIALFNTQPFDMPIMMPELVDSKFLM
jgi:hypothetical protein